MLNRGLRAFSLLGGEKLSWQRTLPPVILHRKTTMGYFFRRSANLGPFRLNFSKSGVGASFGFRGARLTTTPRGTTYVTVGRNGFYYRETLSGRGKRAQSRVPLAIPPIAGAPSDDIPSSKVSNLMDSSSEALINQLNERAAIFNPAWLLCAIAAALLLFGFGSMPQSETHVIRKEPSTLGVNAYPTLVSRYGYPDTVLASKLFGMVPLRTVSYASANLNVVFVQDDCIGPYRKAIDIFLDQRRFPALAKREMKTLRPCTARQEAPWIPVNFTVTASDVDSTIAWVDAERRLDGLATRHESAPAVSEMNAGPGRAPTPPMATTRRQVSDKQVWSVPEVVLRRLRTYEKQNAANVAAHRAKEVFISYGFIVASWTCPQF
jgi:hypothetical protein